MKCWCHLFFVIEPRTLWTLAVGIHGCACITFLWNKLKICSNLPCTYASPGATLHLPCRLVTMPCHSGLRDYASPAWTPNFTDAHHNTLLTIHNKTRKINTRCTTTTPTDHLRQETKVKVKDHLHPSQTRIYHITWHTTLTHQQTSKQHLVHIIINKLYNQYHLVLPKPDTEAYSHSDHPPLYPVTLAQLSVAYTAPRHPPFNFLPSLWGQSPPGQAAVWTPPGTSELTDKTGWVHYGCLPRMQHIIPHN